MKGRPLSQFVKLTSQKRRYRKYCVQMKKFKFREVYVICLRSHLSCSQMLLFIPLCSSPTCLLLFFFFFKHRLITKPWKCDIHKQKFQPLCVLEQDWSCGAGENFHDCRSGDGDPGWCWQCHLLLRILPYSHWSPGDTADPIGHWQAARPLWSFQTRSSWHENRTEIAKREQAVEWCWSLCFERTLSGGQGHFVWRNSPSFTLPFSHLYWVSASKTFCYRTGKKYIFEYELIKTLIMCK